MASSDVIIRTSSFGIADVRATTTPFDDVDEHFFRSNGHLSSDENLLYVEAVPIAAFELKTEKTYSGEVYPSSSNGGEDSTRSKRAIESNDESTCKGEDGKEPDVGEQRSDVGGSRLHCVGEEKKVERHEEDGDVQASLIESMDRLALSSGDQPPSRKTDSEESSDNSEEEKPREIKQQGNSLTDADVLARGPTGGTAVAYPQYPPNCGWIEQQYPGAKRQQFMFHQFAGFGSDAFVDSTLRGSFSAGEDFAVQPSKFRKGPQPVESEDLSAAAVDDASLPFAWLSPKDIAEVLGSDECAALADEFFRLENIPEQSQMMKQGLAPYSLENQFQNGPVIGELFPSEIPASPFLPHLYQDQQQQQQHQQQQQQQPSRSNMTILPPTNPINATSPFCQSPTLAPNTLGKSFQPGTTTDPLNLGSCTGFQTGEARTPESGFGGSEPSQSPHPSMKDSPGREDDFAFEAQDNLAEIEAILNLIENEVQTSQLKHQTAHHFLLNSPPLGKRPPNQVPPTSHILPLVNPPPFQQPANPPSTIYQFPQENPPISQAALGQFHRPPYSTVASFHPVQSSPVQLTSVSSFAGNTSPAIPAGTSVHQSHNQTTREDGGPNEATIRRVKGTNSNVLPDNHLKDQSLTERKQLAKASSVIARLTREQLVTPDSDQDTLLHLAIAKNERYLTEALISRLDRDKLTDSMINLRNKQGQTPLCLATVTNQWALVRLLVDRGADVNVRIPLGAKQTKSFCSPLHFAASNGKEWVRTLEQLLRAKTIDLSALDSEGCSALHKAVMANGLNLFYGRNGEIIDSRESVRLLVLHGIEISQQDGVQSKTALNIALDRGDFDMFYYILSLASPRLSLPLLLNARTGRRGDTLLHVAATLQIDPSHQLTLVRQMLSRGANPQLRNWDNRLPWELATRPQIAEVLQVAVSVGL